MPRHRFEPRITIFCRNALACCLGMLLGQTQAAEAPLASAALDINGQPLYQAARPLFSWRPDSVAASSCPDASTTCRFEVEGQAAAAPIFLPHGHIHAVGSWPEAVTVGDVNGDGRDDVLLTTSFYFDPTNDGSLFVFKQDEHGGLSRPVRYRIGQAVTSVAIGDINGDGRKDVVLGSDRNGGRLAVLRQRSDGKLAAPLFLETEDSRLVRVGDVNSDGLDDVVSIGWGTGTLEVRLQGGKGALRAPLRMFVSHSGYDDLELGDVNGDGRTDIIVMSGQLYADPNIGVIYQQDPQASGALFSSPVYRDMLGSILSHGIGVGDLNGDGLNDIALSFGGNQPESHLAVYSQTLKHTLAQYPVSHDAYDIPEAVEVGDINHDGREDVLVLHGGWMALGIYLQNARGQLETEQLFRIPYASHYNPHGLVVRDFNGDGLKDVAFADYNNGLVTLYQYNPDGFSDLTGQISRAAYVKSTGRLRVGVQVMNGGARATPESAVHFYLSDDEILDVTDSWLAGRTLPGLAAGAGTQLEFAVQAPFDPSGKHLLVYIDPRDRVLELSEANNQLSKPIP